MTVDGSTWSRKASEKTWNGRLALVTGGAGFLGSHLVERLVALGAEVVALDCLERPTRLQQVMPRITYLTADLADWNGSVKTDRAFDVIFHLAAFSTPSAAQENPQVAYRQNVMGTANILQIARRCNVTKCIFTSAGALYTNIPKYLPIDEQHPIDPCQSVYAMTKRIGELLCEEMHRQYALPCLYFRLFNTYGPRQADHFLIPAFLTEARLNGKLTVKNDAIKRDFSYVGDIIEALIRGAESDHSGGPINLGTGVEHSVGDVARKIGALMGVEVACFRQEVFGPTRQVCDNGLARRLLGWEPKVSLDEGLRLTWQAMTGGPVHDSVTSGVSRRA